MARPADYANTRIAPHRAARSLRSRIAACEKQPQTRDGANAPRARQRGAALLRLPTDVLHKIATHTVAPGLVVAAGTNVEARTALRKGTDEAERSRFGGIGLTVREAEHVLRTRYPNILDDSELESREAAGLALTTGPMSMYGGWIRVALGETII